MKITCSSPVEWIEKLFAHYQPPVKRKAAFDLLVLVAGRINSPGPRDERWEYILDMGMPNIAKVLNRKPIGPGPHFFIFPDRWMVPGESVEFGHCLNQNPDAKKFGRVYIVTHAPYILSDCLREQVLILTNTTTK